MFYLAYAILIPALYMPITLMLIALIFRGVASNSGSRPNGRSVWDYAFHYGSLLATFAQGMVLGAFVQGFRVENGRQFAGGTFDWLSPFSVMTGFGLVMGYGLLGATWLVMKTTGELEIWARRKALLFLVGTVVSMAIVQRVGAVPRPRYRDALVYMAQHRLSCPGAAADGVYGVADLPSVRVGAAISPVLPVDRDVPAGLPRARGQSLPVRGAASAHDLAGLQFPSAQIFALVGYAIVMPLTFIYTAYAYYVFRGKVAEDVQSSGYH